MKILLTVLIFMISLAANCQTDSLSSIAKLLKDSLYLDDVHFFKPGNDLPERDTVKAIIIFCDSLNIEQNDAIVFDAKGVFFLFGYVIRKKIGNERDGFTMMEEKMTDLKHRRLNKSFFILEWKKID